MNCVKSVLRVHVKGCVRGCVRGCVVVLAHLLVPIKGCVKEADNFNDDASGGVRDGGEASNVGTYDGGGV